MFPVFAFLRRFLAIPQYRSALYHKEGVYYYATIQTFPEIRVVRKIKSEKNESLIDFIGRNALAPDSIATSPGEHETISRIIHKTNMLSEAGALPLPSILPECIPADTIIQDSMPLSDHSVLINAMKRQTEEKLSRTTGEADLFVERIGCGPYELGIAIQASASHPSPGALLFVGNTETNAFIYAPDGTLAEGATLPAGSQDFSADPARFAQIIDTFISSFWENKCKGEKIRTMSILGDSRETLAEYYAKMGWALRTPRVPCYDEFIFPWALVFNSAHFKKNINHASVIPREIAEKRRLHTLYQGIVRYGFTAIVLVCLVLAGVTISLRHAITGLKDTVDTQNIAVEKLQKMHRENKAIREKVMKLSSITYMSVAKSRIFEILATACPHSIRFNELHIIDNEKRKQISLSATGADNAGISLFYSNLEKEPLFGKVSLLYAEHRSDRDSKSRAIAPGRLIHFAMEIEIK